MKPDRETETVATWRELCAILQRHYPPPQHVSCTSHPQGFRHLRQQLETLQSPAAVAGEGDNTSLVLQPLTAYNLVSDGDDDDSEGGNESIATDANTIAITVGEVLRQSATTYLKHLRDIFHAPTEYYHQSEFTTPSGYIEKEHVLTFMHINRRLAERNGDAISTLAGQTPIYLIRRVPPPRKRTASATGRASPKLGRRPAGTLATARTPSPTINAAAVQHYRRIKCCALEIMAALKVWKDADLRAIVAAVMIVDEAMWRCRGKSEAPASNPYDGQRCLDKVLADLTLT
ncbi:hypothetical protein RI367_001287 [Sorochytrium milnesiophthora]